MTPGQGCEYYLGVALPPLTPRLAQAERVRARCCARLDRDRRRSRRLAAVSQFARHVVAPAILAGLVVLYAADVVDITLRTFTL